MPNAIMNTNNGGDGEKIEAVDTVGRERSVRRGNGRSGEDDMRSGAPCGACKLLRRKCTTACIFAPYFSSDHVGAARFTVLHKIFGAGNVSKLLSRIQLDRRQEAIDSLCYEAEARLSDPAYGCVLQLTALEQQLQQKVVALRMEAQLVKKRLATLNALRRQPQQQQQHMVALQQAGLSSAFATNSSGMLYENQLPMLTSGPLQHHQVMTSSSHRGQSHYPVELLQHSIHDPVSLNYYVPRM